MLYRSARVVTFANWLLFIDRVRIEREQKTVGVLAGIKDEWISLGKLFGDGLGNGKDNTTWNILGTKELADWFFAIEEVLEQAQQKAQSLCCKLSRYTSVASGEISSSCMNEKLETFRVDRIHNTPFQA